MLVHVACMLCAMTGKLLLAIAAIILIPTPAHAIETTAMEQKSSDRGAHTVIVQAPRKAYGLRTVIRRVNDGTPGLHVSSGRCRASVTCIRVTVRNYGRTVWCGPVEAYRGCAQIGGTDPFVRANTYWALDRDLMCHELLHALGLHHHNGRGCLGDNDQSLPSRPELRTLRGLYG